MTFENRKAVTAMSPDPADGRIASQQDGVPRASRTIKRSFLARPGVLKAA